MTIRAKELLLLFGLIGAIFIIMAATARGETLVNAPCGVGYCSNLYKVGDVIDLTATPDAPNTYFAGWTATNGVCVGAGHCKFTITAAMPYEINVNSVFEEYDMENLWVNVYGLAGGRVVSTPAGIDCVTGNLCRASFRRGTYVVLKATPPTGKTKNWVSFTGCSATALTCTVSMSNARVGNVLFK